MAKKKTEKTQPTVDEIIAALKKTGLPTIICEGSNDLIVYRRFEHQLGHLGVSILPAGGRNNVLEIFNRRAEIPSSVQLAFVADQDTWINTNIPLNYQEPSLLFTDGYSIENDVFCDGELDSILSGPEKPKFQNQLYEFIEWYALALNRHLLDSTNSISLHPQQVLDPTQRPELLKLQTGEIYPNSTRTTLLTGYKKLVRGKSLLSLLVHSTNSRPGQPKHTDKALLEMVAARPGPCISRLRTAIEALFA